MQTLALVTDLYYAANGREYYREDILLGQLLRTQFHVLLVHLEDLSPIAGHVDAILLRNTWPKINHHSLLDTVKNRLDWPVFNDLGGEGDLCGKQHLLTLFENGYPVIPTVSTPTQLDRLPVSQQYLVKPIDGCDSQGLHVVERKALQEQESQGQVIQPLVDLEYEVSFYFIGSEFQYALYAPNKTRRWELSLYEPTREDLEFAYRFIHWNGCRRGIHRVDACRTQEGELLLMELEDYNPYLSLQLLPEDLQRRFVRALSEQINEFLAVSVTS